ncbi:glycosyltransferase [bacterium]|nr:glycosyltransferase [bacterium]
MSNSYPKVMVIIPTYNEKENIPNMIQALFALEVPNFHLLIVDDDSPDGTGDIADDYANRDSYKDRIFVLHRLEKKGFGPAYKDGFKKAVQLGADLIIQMDADFSHQPKYIPQMLELSSKFDVVVGSRYIKGGSVDENRGPIRKLLSWWANRIYTPLILNFPVKDATGGFRLFHRDAIVGMDVDQVLASGYVFQVEMIYVAHKLGYKIGELAIHFPDRQVGTSKMKSSIAVEAALRVWQIKFRHGGLNQARRRTHAYTSKGSNCTTKCNIICFS